MITMKFGGTSMGSAKMIAEVGKIICETKKNGEYPLVVVSAMSGVTNQLLEASQRVVRDEESEEKKKIVDSLRYKHVETAKALISDTYELRKIMEFIHTKLDHFSDFLDALGIIGEISSLSHDEIISLGEKLSAALLSAHLQSIGAQSVYGDLSKIIHGEFKNTDGNFFDHTQNEMKKVVQPIIDNGSIPVLTGFFGKIPGGIVKAVGRGYSDFTAALLGAAFHVKEIQIWTDVDGLLSADPRMVKYTCVLPEVSYDEAGELAQFGAKVLHPQTVWPAVKKDIPVRIKNTMNPLSIGTLITRKGAKGNHLCKSIASKKCITVVTLTSPRMLMAVGFLSDIFAIFKKYDISVDLVTTGEISITITINRVLKDIPKNALTELRKFAKMDILEHQSIICVVGTELSHKKGTASKILAAIAESGVSVHAISQSAREINISFIIDETDADVALKALHRVIFEGNEKINE